MLCFAHALPAGQLVSAHRQTGWVGFPLNVHSPTETKVFGGSTTHTHLPLTLSFLSITLLSLFMACPTSTSERDPDAMRDPDAIRSWTCSRSVVTWWIHNTMDPAHQTSPSIFPEGSNKWERHLNEKGDPPVYLLGTPMDGLAWERRKGDWRQMMN